jgi:hypothetical protein
VTRVRTLLLYAVGADNRTMSYQQAWPRHFQRHARFSCTSINVADRRVSARLRTHLLVRRDRYDAVVLLHSVFSNACMVGQRLLDALARVPAPKAYFIGNEYKLMPEKMAFSEVLGVSLLISQTDSAAVHRLYRERLGCSVVGVPNTGLDPELFRPRTPVAERPIDLGYRATEGPDYWGHDERRRIADFFLAHAERYRLQVDISTRPEDRFTESAWADFLDRCKGQLGAEAGSDYFELTDGRRRAINAYLKTRRGVSQDEIFARFFANAMRVPIRILSGRNVEAAGTKTVQILFEGGYGGYLEPDVHYIPLRKDLSDADVAIEKFRDTGFCAKLVDNAYAVAAGELTYTRLIDRFYAALAPLL